jgi:acetylornithine/N-succinyldiaminopimelate aminotransferase
MVRVAVAQVGSQIFNTPQKRLMTWKCGVRKRRNPLAMAVATEVLDIISAPAFLERVRDASLRLMLRIDELISKYPTVFSEVRGAGILVGLQCAPPARDVLAMLHDHKLLCVPAGNNVLRLLPPLTVTDTEIDEAVLRLDRVAERLSDAVAARLSIL